MHQACLRRLPSERLVHAMAQDRVEQTLLLLRRLASKLYIAAVAAGHARPRLHPLRFSLQIANWGTLRALNAIDKRPTARE